MNIYKCPICNTEMFARVGKCKCGHILPENEEQQKEVVVICSACRNITIQKNKDFIGGERTVCPQCSEGYWTTLGSPEEWASYTDEQKEKFKAMVPNEKTTGLKADLTVKCPYCQSTNTNKITKTSKAVHTAFFGIFSMGRNSKEWHCNNCNSDF